MKFKIKYFNGKTAIDLARLKKNEKIYNILMEFKKNIKSSELKKVKQLGLIMLLLNSFMMAIFTNIIIQL